MKTRPLALAALLGLSALAQGAPHATATLILLNGKIWTENPHQPEADALAIEGDHILAVGTSATIRALAGPDCKVIDLQGRRVVPGFNDAHVHLISGGNSLISVQLGDANSETEFRDARLSDGSRLTIRPNGPGAS